MSIDFLNDPFSKVEKNVVGLKERYDLIVRILNTKMRNEGLEEY